MPEAEADSWLIDAVRAGDSDAWRELISRYQGRLLSFAKRMLADRSEAEDLVQDTFIGLLRSLPTYDRERSLETYLFAILRNKLHDHFRKARPGSRESLDSLEMEDAPQVWLDRDTPSHRVRRDEALKEQRTALARALRSWADACCDQHRFDDLMLIEMLVVLGLRNKEAAADLGLSETAVAGLKFRVLDQWRKLLAPQIESLDLSESDLARDTSLGRIWREEGVSCPKRSTLGRYVLGVLDVDWNRYIDFHADTARCERCSANLDDLREEEDRDARSREELRDRCFQSSVGFLSKTGGV